MAPAAIKRPAFSVLAFGGWSLCISAALLLPEPPAQAAPGVGLHGPHRHVHLHPHRYRYRPYYRPYYPLYDRWPYDYPTETPEQRAERVRREPWESLSHGSSKSVKRALAIFAKRVRNDAADAEAKLGYALASALLGDRQRGVWAMRRALLTDSEALRVAPLDPVLRMRVAGLVELYHPEDHSQGHDGDAHFMVAALLFVAGDLGSASSAVDFAIDDGDGDASTLALEAAIARASAARAPAPQGAPAADPS